MTDPLSVFDAEFLKLRTTDEVLRTRQYRQSRYNSIFINFFNLPTGHDGYGGGGAEVENNRMMFLIEVAKDGKLKIQETVSALPRTHRLRTKTASPEKLVAYLGDFLRKVIAEVPPNFTHSK